MTEEKATKLAHLLDLLNINGVTYQLINKHEFDKTYVKVTILSRYVKNTYLSLFYTVYDFDEDSGYFDLGDDIYVTFDTLEVEMEDDEITFAQRFLREFCDEVINAECIGGNVNVFMEKLPDGIGKYIRQSQKVVGQDFIRYNVKRDKKTLTLAIPRNAAKIERSEKEE